MTNARSIQSTTDYTLFKQLKSNRTLYKPHVKKLVAAFESNPRSNAYNPILVNENMEVIDGQHRLAALTELHFPVHFIMGEGLTVDDAQAINAGGKPWSPMDYARSYASQGRKAYAFYVELKTTYKLNHDTLLRFIALEEPTTGEAFRLGRLHITDKKRTESLCKEFAQVVRITGNKHRALAFAFMELWEGGADTGKLLKRLSEYYQDGRQLGAYKDVADYRNELVALLG